MSDTKLTNLTATTSPVDADLIYIVTDVATTPASKKVTWTSVKAFLKTYFDTLYAAALGADDNYVTNAEKTKLANLSGTNSGDNAPNSSALALDQTTPQTIINGQPIQNTLTASEIVATDANKKLQSLAVATYPSLAELAHVKGVTSAIQTQLTASSLVDGSRAFTNPVVGVLPTASDHLATKEYVDMSVSFSNTFYFNNTASSIGGIYYKMLELSTGEAESTFTSGTLTTGNNQALFNFATDAGIPGVTNLRAGVYSAHIHAQKATGTKPVKLYFAIYTRTTGGVETLRATSELSSYLTTKTDVTLHTNIASDITIDPTDRIIIKWFANVEATGTDVTVSLFAEGTDASRLSTPTSTEILSSIFVRQDGTKPLTANWDAGSFEIRAETFESDVATGTAPMTVASTTAVTNLNADLVDGIHGTDLVAKSTYDAHSILAATTDNTPAALTVTEQTLVGRVTGGNIAAIAIDSDLSSVSANHDTIPSAKATKDYIDSGTATLTNKRITPQITTITSHATPTVNTDATNCVTITALAGAITNMSTNLSGTPTNFQSLLFRIKDDGTARAITWGTSFEAGSVALPTTTVLGKTLLVGFKYDSVDSKWACEASGSRA